ncbi:hypothetical protein GY03_05735 [Proteus vulgaris]|uniref:hypothetical protein n=1 Tax=Proteus vulgaris TaxID=585 RepID=UPI0021B0F45B|nr:hypothetical protein [Proteus vulgaris]MCT6516775.1 hypothetical protein [Proteus vulgaris]
MNNTENQNWPLLAAFCIVGIIGLVISSNLGVPILTAFKIIPSLLIWGVAVFAITYYGFILISSPLIIATLWLVFIPVWDYKAGIRNDDFPIKMDIAWYGTGLGQISVFIGILLIGYGLFYLKKQYID